MSRPATRLPTLLNPGPGTLYGLLIATAVGLLLTACATQPAPTHVQLMQVPFASPSLAPTFPSTPLSASPTTRPAPTMEQERGTATPTCTATPTPTVIFTPSPTPPPEPTLRRLTSGGCCTNPFWSADSRQVQFIDRPASRPVGIYGVEVKNPGPATLVTEWIVNTSGNGAFYVYPAGDTTIVQRAATGEEYVIANGGRAVSVSPGGQRSLWNVMEQRGNFDQRRSQVWVANVDGSEARVVAETVGLGWGEWIDDRRVLLVGLPQEDQSVITIATLTLGADGSDEQLLVLAHVIRPRGTLVSPRGNWLVYFLTFQEDPAADGLWVVPTDGSRPPRKLDFFGGYRWRDDTHLLYVPTEPGAESHALWEYDVVSDASRRLTDPVQTPFKIANNDWAVSPNGRYVVFVNAADHNLWLVDLEPPDSDV